MRTLVHSRKRKKYRKKNFDQRSPLLLMKMELLTRKKLMRFLPEPSGQQNRREIHGRRQSRLLMTVHIGEHSLLMYRERRNIFWLTAIISFLPGKN